MDKKVIKNYLYNLSYQILAIIVPFITIPYVSRVMGPTGIGINAYTYSIIQYIVILVTLGIPFYASREIAYKREDKAKLSSCFWEIFFMQLFLAVSSFIICIILFNKLKIFEQYKYALLFQSIAIISTAFDITWFFTGIENFKTIVTRNIIVKLIGTISIFIFVKSPSDLYKYIFLNVFFNLLGQVIMWISLINVIKSPFRCKLRLKDAFTHLYSSVIKFFIPQIATSIYTVLDRTMLGSMSSMNEVAYYDQSQKLVKILLVIVTSLGSVMLPRMSNLYSNGEKEKLNRFFLKSLTFTIAITIPLIFGIIGAAPEFVGWFFGDKFMKVIPLLQLFAPIILIISLSNVFGIQYLIPIGKNIGYTLGVCLAAVVNIILNFILIPKYGSVGSTISTVIAELAAACVMLYFISKYFKLSVMFKGSFKYILSGIIMIVLIRLTASIINIKIVTTSIQIFVGIISYFLCLLVLKENLIISTIFSFINNKIKYKNH